MSTSSPDSLPNRYRALLRKVIATPALHARWLNTLSLLEHIGSRKIIKALDSTLLTEELLRHIAEETRHALFFKQLARRVDPRACLTFEEPHLLCGRESKDYFQSLDRTIETALEGSHVQPHRRTMLNYLGVTYLIEVRANELYAIYEDVLREAGMAFSLRSVIAEESRHLEDVQEALSALAVRAEMGPHEPWLQQWTELERPLFASWLDALQQTVDLETLAPRDLACLAGPTNLADVHLASS